MASVIVKFPSQDARESFLRRARQSWPELTDKIYPAKRRPDTVIEALADDDLPRLEELVQDLGKVYGDVRFDPLPAH